LLIYQASPKKAQAAWQGQCIIGKGKKKRAIKTIQSKLQKEVCDSKKAIHINKE